MTKQMTHETLALMTRLVPVTRISAGVRTLPEKWERNDFQRPARAHIVPLKAPALDQFADNYLAEFMGGVFLDDGDGNMLPLAAAKAPWREEQELEDEKGRVATWAL